MLITSRKPGIGAGRPLGRLNYDGGPWRLLQIDILAFDLHAIFMVIKN